MHPKELREKFFFLVSLIGICGYNCPLLGQDDGLHPELYSLPHNYTHCLKSGTLKLGSIGSNCIPQIIGSPIGHAVSGYTNMEWHGYTGMRIGGYVARRYMRL